MAGGRKPGTPKTGGKVKGSRTRNKRTVAKQQGIHAYCAAKGYDPLRAMIDLACDETQALALRIDLHKEVAKYIHPRLSARELNLGEETRRAILHRYGQARATPREPQDTRTPQGEEHAVCEP
jgi:hypothetical protein